MKKILIYTIAFALIINIIGNLFIVPAYANETIINDYSDSESETKNDQPVYQNYPISNNDDLADGIAESTSNDDQLISDDEFTRIVKNVTLQQINQNFENDIFELNDLKNKEKDNKEKEYINSKIQTKKNLLLRTKNLTDKQLNDGKNYILKILKNKKEELNESATISATTNNTTILTSILLTISVGRQMGYMFTADLLEHSLEATFNSTYYISSSSTLVSSRVKESTYYSNQLSTLKNHYENSGQSYWTSSYSFDFDGSSSSTIEKDLYYAMHKVTGSIAVDDGSAHLVIKDYYDFPPLKWPDSFSTALNDLGALGLASGVIKPYYVRVNVNENFSNYIPPQLSPIPYPGYALTYGSTGNNVKLVQNRLNQLGFNCGSVDGSFGPATESAIISFQSSRGLATDASVGPSTWEELFYPPIQYPGYALTYGSTGINVLMVQTRLNQLGFNCGSPDGSFGPATRSAVISFQSSRGFATDASVGPTTWNSLFNL